MWNKKRSPSTEMNGQPKKKLKTSHSHSSNSNTGEQTRQQSTLDMFLVKTASPSSSSTTTTTSASVVTNTSCRQNAYAGLLEVSSDSEDTVPVNTEELKGVLVEEELIQYNLTVDLADADIEGIDKWDDFHVKLACSPSNTYRLVTDPTTTLPKWNLITEALTSDLKSGREIRDAILSYNPRQTNKWDFSGLRFFLKKVLSFEEKTLFFGKILPAMTKLALRLPNLIKKPIPILFSSMEAGVLFSQEQAACLLANMFFCTFPMRNSRNDDLPTVNFNQLYTQPCDKSKQGKLRCLLNYFRRVCQKMPEGNISFRRLVMDEFPEWEDSETKLTKLAVSSNGTIEDNGINMLQVDFANKLIGGGVIGHGCVQEEIRFVINPECIIGRLFSQELKSNEAIIIKGAESGYAKSFQWTGDYIDTTERDDMKRINTEITVIDAIKFHNPLSQYSEEAITRELNKAYTGFYLPSLSSDPTSVPHPIATGNWGCGIFNGSKELKSLLQLMAASENGRDVHYFTFGDEYFHAQLESIYEVLVEDDMNVGRLMQLLISYADSLNSEEYVDCEPPTLFEFITSSLC